MLKKGLGAGTLYCGLLLTIVLATALARAAVIGLLRSGEDELRIGSTAAEQLVENATGEEKNVQIASSAEESVQLEKDGTIYIGGDAVKGKLYTVTCDGITYRRFIPGV